MPVSRELARVSIATSMLNRNNLSIYEYSVTEEINLDEQRRVETIEEIAALPLDTESVFVSRLTDLKVEALSRLNRLRILFQDGSPRLTDSALSTLGKMSSLEYLDLEWNDDITDRGLQCLYGLGSLRWLDIGFCGLITPQGVASLRLALPLCEIIDAGIGHRTKLL